MAQKAQIADGLDLSSLRAAINCSEPVRAESMDAFATRFEASGFRRSALHTCYALAEATFAVTQSTSDRPPTRLRVSRAALGAQRVEESPTGERTLVSSGRALSGIEVRIVDDRGGDLAAGQVGEIWIRGDFVMDGYLAAPDHPRVAQPVFSPDGWYRTGDLGAVVDGELYVTGRKKDLIIVGGINIFPEDVEAAASEVQGVHAGRAVAMGFEDLRAGTERLVLVAEANDESDLLRATEIEAELRRASMLVCGVAPFKVFVVPPRWIVKSTAGKISRAETRARVLERWRELTNGQPAPDAAEPEIA
jgi:acyl-CoA synthetase (AMP-forming)/AMP-acid ligase II